MNPAEYNRQFRRGERSGGVEEWKRGREVERGRGREWDGVREREREEGNGMV